MKSKIKYKAMTQRGKIVNFTINTIHPNFEVKTKHFSQEVNGKVLKINYEITTEQQIMEWLDEQDRSNMMYDRDLACIIDYKVIKKEINQKTEIERIKEILSQFKYNESIVIDFIVAFKEMKDSIKGLSIEKKMKIVADSLLLSYKSKSAGYKDILKILRGGENTEVKLISK